MALFLHPESKLILGRKQNFRMTLARPICSRQPGSLYSNRRMGGTHFDFLAGAADCRKLARCFEIFALTSVDGVSK
jgi:hypothetical protein